MPTYSVHLTEDQEVALLFETERWQEHAQRMQAGTGMATPPPTPQQVLKEKVSQLLELDRVAVTQMVEPLLEMVLSTPTEGRQRIIDAMPRASLRLGVQRGLQRKP